MRSLQLLNLTRPPGLIEPRLQRAVEPQDGVPALARNGLYPVAFLAGRRFGTEVHVRRLILVNHDALLLATEAWELLVSLEHRARLIVVEHHRPEVLRRDVRRQVQLVGLPAVQRLALGVNERDGVLRTFPDGLGIHRGRDAGRVEEEERTRVEHANAVLLELVAADEREFPRAVREELGLLQWTPVSDGACRRLADRRRLGEDLLHPRVGLEGFALLDTDGRKQAERFRVDGSVGL